MRRGIVSGLFVLALMMVAASTAFAQAVVIDPAGNCILLDGNGRLVLTTDIQIVATQSQNGNTLLRCRAQGVANSTGRGQAFDINNNPLGPLLCIIISPLPPFVIFDDDWHITVSASGNARLTCHNNAN